MADLTSEIDEGRDAIQRPHVGGKRGDVQYDCAFLVVAYHVLKALVADVDDWLAQTLSVAALPQLEQIKKDAREAVAQFAGRFG